MMEFLYCFATLLWTRFWQNWKIISLIRKYFVLSSQIFEFFWIQFTLNHGSIFFKYKIHLRKKSTPRLNICPIVKFGSASVIFLAVPKRNLWNSFSCSSEDIYIKTYRTCPFRSVCLKELRDKAPVWRYHAVMAWNYCKISVTFMLCLN